MNGDPIVLLCPVANMVMRGAVWLSLDAFKIGTLLSTCGEERPYQERISRHVSVRGC